MSLVEKIDMVGGARAPMAEIAKIISEHSPFSKILNCDLPLFGKIDVQRLSYIVMNMYRQNPACDISRVIIDDFNREYFDATLTCLARDVYLREGDLFLPGLSITRNQSSDLYGNDKSIFRDIKYHAGLQIGGKQWGSISTLIQLNHRYSIHDKQDDKWWRDKLDLVFMSVALSSKGARPAIIVSKQKIEGIFTSYSSAYTVHSAGHKLSGIQVIGMSELVLSDGVLTSALIQGTWRSRYFNKMTNVARLLVKARSNASNDFADALIWYGSMLEILFGKNAKKRISSVVKDNAYAFVGDIRGVSTKDAVHIAYDLRSRVAHGDIMEFYGEQKKRAEINIAQIDNIVRRAIFKIIQEDRWP